MAESCLGMLQLLFCGTVRQKKGNKAPKKESEGDRVKIRVGFEGKDTLFSTKNLNVKSTFGQFAVLLDYASNKLVPLHSNGSVMEPLEARRKYVVVLNTHGSSSHKWEDLRKHKGGKKHRKHGNGKHSIKKKRSISNAAKPSPPTKIPNKTEEENVGEEVKEPLLVEDEDDDEEDYEEEEEQQQEKEKEKEQEQEQPVTNFATIDFGVSSSMDSMISHSREVYVY